MRIFRIAMKWKWRSNMYILHSEFLCVKGMACKCYNRRL